MGPRGGLEGRLVKRIETGRLLLREFVEDDAEAVQEYASDPEVVTFMPWGPNTQDETRDFIARAIAARNEEPRMKHDFAIILKSTEVLIGGCGIYLTTKQNREGSIGYCTNRLFWGLGHATEVAEALIDFGFSELRLHRIFATCDPANIASARVLEKSGMQHEGRMRENEMLRGRWRDSSLYAVLEHEWKAR